MKEWDILGLYVPPFFFFAVLSFLLVSWGRVYLARAGLYRFVWHRALVDLALWVIVSGVVVALFG